MGLCAAPLSVAQQNPVFIPCQTHLHGTAFYGAECTQITASTQGSANLTTLNVLRARAKSAPKPDPLVVITGGPATSAVSLAWQYLRFFYAVQKERDIIFIDQRGTGKTAPFNCPAAANLDPSLSATELVIATQTALITCAKEQSNLTAINTTQAAYDLETVRTALGYKQLNLWGSSYGTRVALEYQRLFGNTSRTVIIDGVAPAVIGLPRYAEEDASHALAALFDACNAQPACLQAFGDLRPQWQTLIKHLQQTPVQATLMHPRTQTATPITITAPMLANWVRFALYSRELSALLPLAIQSATQGDFQPIANLAQAAGDSVQDGMSHGMHAAILCAEDQHAPTLQRPATTPTLPQMPFANLNDLSPVCSALPSSTPPPALFTPVKSAVPTLVLSGQFDPITPAFWGDWASQQLSHHQHWQITGGHHGVSGLGCMPNLIAQFITAAGFKSLNTDCLNDIQPIAFFVDAAGPALDTPLTNTATHD